MYGSVNTYKENQPAQNQEPSDRVMLRIITDDKDSGEKMTEREQQEPKLEVEDGEQNADLEIGSSAVTKHTIGRFPFRSEITL